MSRFLFLAPLLLCPLAWAQSGSQPLATVNSHPIYEVDLAASVHAQVLQLRNQEYQAKLRGLDDAVDRLVLDQEAKRRGLTSDQLLKLEVDAKISDPTPGEIEAYYLGQRLTQPLETVQVQISQNIRQARAQKARADWIRSLRQAAKVDILLGPPRTEVEMDESRRKGGGRAPVTIVEFGDFECPFCRQAEATVKEVLAKYGDRVQFSFRDYPLRSIHPSAQGAAEAARCALEQGKFWEYHDLLFANPDKLNRAGFLELGGKMGLDSARLGRCMDEGAHRAAIEKDVQSGTRAGVNATPAFFVNGILLTGAQPASAFERLIDEELRRQR